MAYVPINIAAYTAAYSGAISSITTTGWIVDPTAIDYDLMTKIAGAFSQAFDTVWNNATLLNNLEITAISLVVSENFAKRGPGPTANPQFVNPANWVQSAAACAALVLQSDIYFAGQGIAPGTPVTTSDQVINKSGVLGASVTNALNNLNSSTGGLILGPNLPNADITINPGDGFTLSILPAATLNAPHTVTLGVAGVIRFGSTAIIQRNDRTANAYNILDGGTGAQTYVTQASAINNLQYIFVFNSNSWVFQNCVPTQ